MRKFLTKVMAVAMMASPLMAAVPAWAEGTSCGGVPTNLIHCSDENEQGQAISSVLIIVVNVLSGIVMSLAVVGIVIAGVQYLTARDNESQMAKSKSRLFQIVLGLVAFVLMWAFLNWLIPGGNFNASGS